MNIKILISFLLFISHAEAMDSNLTLEFSNGSSSLKGQKAINQSFEEIGVYVRQVDVPKEAYSIIKTSFDKSLSSKEQVELISLFSLHRGELLDEIKLAGRLPGVNRGGYLSTSEVGVAPYPKVYDMKSLDDKMTIFLQKKFGKLHVNSAEDGAGIDEVMTIVSGGPYTWFFAYPNGVVGKLILPRVNIGDKAWRISYPGLVPHGGFFDAKDGLVVAYAHGPKNFVMRYEDPSVFASQILGTNPWIDFKGKVPKLLNQR